MWGSRLVAAIALSSLHERGRFGLTSGIRVEDVVDQLDMLNEATQVYLDLETGSFLTILDPLIVGEDELDDQPDPDDLDPERFVAFPSQFDVHEWAILRDFCADVEDHNLRRRLLRALHGSGAFRNTKGLPYEHDLLDAWYTARSRAFERIARDRLHSLGLDSDLGEATDR